ncbi:MAG TPA: alpha-1,4-glucan--maltose-1-phosphate maltosyltransferase [Acidimicrobiia bacterium]|nr:alpha-1,4-glucan--maltose-1-phosphate maltosyltransferase [Acidimicrobiia bacterium]
MTDRIVIEGIRPSTPSGFPAKAVVGRPVRITADVFRDGHDILAARVRFRRANGAKGKWSTALMRPLGNDRYEAVIEPAELGAHEFVIEGWTDRLATWRHEVTVKLSAGQNVELELEEGARLLEAAAQRIDRPERGRLQTAIDSLRNTQAPAESRLSGALEPSLVSLLDELPDPSDLTKSKAMPLWVDRERAVHGAWYELFPRSYADPEKGLNALQGATERLTAVANMGFDVVYVPPVHPIGRSFRKGRNNSLDPAPGDPGSPWAIGAPGSPEEGGGGHLDLHPELGSFEDFDAFVAKARSLGMEIALDYALQASPEHPWVKEHPEWFHHRPDGTIKYAENPPKKYQDIYPINMWPANADDRMALWQACKEVLDFWIGHGIRIFRVDNPHTKPFAFWQWVIKEIQAKHPEIVFLAEAFTRPKLMARLAEVGFSQSYTYFTWRNTKAELQEYFTEVCLGPKADYMRPNFWPNTPDILSGILRGGGPGAFRLRLVLAACSVPSYGIYSGYELCENQPMSDANEEYFESEKYEIKHRDFSQPGSLAPFVSRINDIRRRHPAFADLGNIAFHHSNNDQILCWSKMDSAADDVMLMVVNLDPHNIHEDTLSLDLPALGFEWNETYEAFDELTGMTFIWTGAHPYVRLDPGLPAHVLHLRRPGRGA